MPSNDPTDGWERTLYRLVGEMEEYFGVPGRGFLAPDLETLTRLAWREARLRQRALDQAITDV